MTTGIGTNSFAAGGGGGAKGEVSYGSLVKAKIASKKVYPRASKKRNETGLVLVQVTISYTGELVEVKIVKSSGLKRLDRATLKAVKRAAPFPAPTHLASGQNYVSRIPVEFLLR